MRQIMSLPAAALAAIVVFLSIFTSCQEKIDTSEPSISGIATFLLEAAEGSTDTIVLSLNSPWAITDVPDW